MTELVEDLATLPLSAHGLSLHSSRGEAARHAAEFIAGTTAWQAAAYWVPDAATAGSHAAEIADRAPDHVGCVAIMSHEQVAEEHGKLRPVPEVLAFLREHPNGVTAAGETLSQYLDRKNLDQHLEYERWFQDQPRDRSRFLCPYDLRRLPPERAPHALRELGEHHTHVAISRDPHPVVQMLQLFLFRRAKELPPALVPTFADAVRRNAIRVDPGTGEFSLTPAGEAAVQSWSDSVSRQVDGLRPPGTG